MISIILAILVIYVFLKRNVSLSKNYEICRPKTYYFAAITAGAIVIIEIFSRTMDTFSTLLYIVIIIVPAISAILLRQKKIGQSPQEEVSKFRKIENKLSWFILIAIVVFFVGLYIYDLLK